MDKAIIALVGIKSVSDEAQTLEFILQQMDLAFLLILGIVFLAVFLDGIGRRRGL